MLPLGLRLCDGRAAGQLDAADENSDGVLCLEEFTKYCTQLDKWLRRNLLGDYRRHRKHVLAKLAERGVEARVTPPPRAPVAYRCAPLAAPTAPQ